MTLKNKKLPTTNYQLPTKQAGFTLFETLIYISIAGIILVSFVQFSLSISNSRNKNYVVQEVQANARTAVDLISQKIKLADDVVSPTEGASSGSLILDMPSPDPNLTFSVDGTSLSINEGAGEKHITSGKINVTNLNFTNLAGSGERDNIRVELTVEYINSGDANFTFSKSVQTAVSLRK